LQLDCSISKEQKQLESLLISAGRHVTQLFIHPFSRWRF